MKIKLIGLYGQSRSGKDECAKILAKDFGFEQRAMAAGIREILCGLNPLIKDNEGGIWELLDLVEDCHGDWDLIKARSSDSTEYMIRLGQTCRNVLDETVWLDRVLPDGEIKNKICISDLRQPNEYKAIKARGGIVWKVTRPGSKKHGMDGLLDHLQFDFHIINEGSIEDLRSIIQAAMVKQFEKERYANI